MQSAAHKLNSSRAYQPTVTALPDLVTAYDTVGAYDQDAINGFSDDILTT